MHGSPKILADTWMDGVGPVSSSGMDPLMWECERAGSGQEAPFIALFDCINWSIIQFDG